MSILNLTGDERLIFKCPNCGNCISASVCPKCSSQITDEVKSKSAESHAEDVSQEDKTFYKPIIYGGSGALVFGLLTIFLSFSEGRFPMDGYALMIAGAGALFYGFYCFNKER